MTGYLSEARRKVIDQRLAGIFANADADAGLRDARRLAAQLRAEHPDAVGSLLEGLEEMFTVARLGITGALRRSLTNTNCIESMISTVRTVTGRVKTWHDGDMKKRWITTGMIEAQRSFRRIRGHTDMANLISVVGHATNPVSPCNTRRLRSSCCVSNTRITTAVQQQAGKRLLPTDKIEKIRYFTARVSARPDEPQQAIRQETYLRALATFPVIELHFGHYVTRPTRMALAKPPQSGPRTVEVLKTEEKGSDVNLASYLLLDASKGRCTTAVVITNDSDLAYESRRVVGFRGGSTVR